MKMKALYFLEIYGNQVKELQKVCRISCHEYQLPFMRKFINSQQRELIIGNSGPIIKLSSLYWIKQGNIFLRPRYRYDYDKQTTIAVYNISENIKYTVKKIDIIYHIILKNKVIEEYK